VTGTARRSTAPPTAADYLARHRGGGLFTETVNQRVASHLCVLAYRFGLAPTVLSVANLVLGLAAAGVVVALARPVAEGRVPAAAVGFGALLLWQLAYSLDCADGQLARVTGAASPAGKRVDVLCDVALQVALVAAVAAVAHQYPPRPPSWLVAAFAAGWMVNLVTSTLQQTDAAGSLVTSGSPAVRVVKLVRDYGAVVTVIGLTLAFAPQWTGWLLVGFTVVNLAFLLLSIAVTVRASLRPARD
jgi:phosphatidylglycerophosphate synthase